MHSAFLLGLLAASLAALAVLGYQVWSRRATDRAILRGLEALREGSRVHQAKVPAGGPARELARAFNEVGPELERRLNRLEEDRHLLEAVFAGMNEGVIALDARRRLLFANSAAVTYLALPADYSGQLVAELIRLPSLQAVIDATESSRAPADREIVVSVRSADRERPRSRVIAVHGAPLPGSGGPRTVLVLHDVTELRRLERMRQDFVANASHELKTPLAAIRAYTETLEDGAIDDPDVKYNFLRRIGEQADRLHHLILDMLSLARLESGETAFRHEPIRVLQVVRALVEAHRDRAVGKRQKLHFEHDQPAESAVVPVDEEALRQIIDNLLDNAIKYTPEGGRIRVSCSATEENVVLSVRDSGIGIPRDDLSRVFERFFRVDKARSREVGGTGLGLSIVKHLVSSLGGRVEVESRLNAGSLFRVVMPRYHPPAGGDEAIPPSRAGKEFEPTSS